MSDGSWRRCAIAAIAAALDQAGIAYRTGTPWTAAMLSRKAAKARAQTKRKAALTAAMAGPTTAPAIARPTEPAHRPAAAETESDEPEFRPASMPGRPPPDAAAKPASPPQTQDADAVIARLLGRPRHGVAPMPDVPQPEEDA